VLAAVKFCSVRDKDWVTVVYGAWHGLSYNCLQCVKRTELHLCSVRDTELYCWLQLQLCTVRETDWVTVVYSAWHGLSYIRLQCVTRTALELCTVRDTDWVTFGYVAWHVPVVLAADRVLYVAWHWTVLLAAVSVLYIAWHGLSYNCVQFVTQP